jgi:hypothetical protein
VSAEPQVCSTAVMPILAPRCLGSAAIVSVVSAARQAELLPVGYFHVVFTLPGPIADIAYQNKTVIYDLFFKAFGLLRRLGVAASTSRFSCSRLLWSLAT